MAAAKNNSLVRRRRYKGRFEQIGIYFGKFLRMFIFQNDWKVLPMAAVISGMVAMVIKPSFGVHREGTLMGALALCCVGLWNGCFNSIQVICRERGIVKREHYSGMHVSSYTIAHLIYQTIICLMQTAVTVYVCYMLGVNFPKEGVILGSFLPEFCITIFGITIAADMTSLFISSIVHSTTAAMTVMPFVLIFQLIFSGGLFAVPRQLSLVYDFTISNYGIKCIAAEAGYNELPVTSGWNTVYNMRNTEIGGTFTPEQAVLLLGDPDSHFGQTVSAKEVADSLTVGDLAGMLKDSPEYPMIKDRPVTVRFTIWDVIELVGYEKAREVFLEKTKETGMNPKYERTEANVKECWIRLYALAALFCLLTMVSLKFIDKDKR